MKKVYEKPLIQQVKTGITNKFGEAPLIKAQDSIDEIKISDLVQSYDSPLFVFSENTIIKKYQEISSAFLHRYPNVVHAWSYKTNYLKSICKIFHNLGSWAEVVSQMEYEMATKLGVSPQNIIFNGPAKTYNDLKRALKEGALVNIESFDELNDVENIAEEFNSKVNIGIRVNVTLEPYVGWDRFGFSVESGYAYQAVKKAKLSGKININGIHCHVGTFILEPEIYKTEVEKLVSFAKRIKDDFGFTIKYIDIGGGLPSCNKLKGSFFYNKDMIKPPENYADAICTQLLSSFKPDELPLLIHETGRALIDEAGTLITTVCATKRLGNNIRGVVIDAGVNLLVTSYWYDLDVIPTKEKGQDAEDHVIFGPLCMQIDVVKNSVNLPGLEKGDLILIHPVGAYNNTQWMQFITLRPNVVMISKNGKIDLIRKAETIDYLQERERIPEWLQKSGLH